MSSILKVNTLQDGGGNAIITSDGSGNLTTQNILTPSFLVKLSSNQTIGSGSSVKVQLDSEVYDTDNAFDNSTNYRFTVPSGKAGKYSFLGHVMLPGVDTNEYGAIAFYKNGSIITESQGREQKASDNRDTFIACSYSLSLAVDDYIEVYAYQNSGGTKNADYMHFSGFRVGT